MRLILVCLLALSGIAGYSQFPDWVRKNGPEGGAVIDLEIDPSNGRVYALVEQNPYISDDNGVSWEKLNVNEFNNFYNDIEISGSNVYMLSSFGIDISADGGQNFVEGDLTGVLSSASKIRRLSNGNLVALSFGGTYTSTNNGMNWTAHASGFFNSNYLVVNNVDQVFAISQSAPTYGFPVRSGNGGTSFIDPGNVNITGGGTVYSLAVDNARTTVYAVNSTAIWSSTDASAWSSIKGAISDATIAGSSSNPSFMFFSTDALQMFFIDNVNHKIWSKAVADPPSSWAVNATAFIDNSLQCLSGAASTATDLVFGTFPGIYTSTDGGGTVTSTNQGLSEQRATQMAWSGGTLFVATENSGLFQSGDDGATWESSNVPDDVVHISANTDVSTAGSTQTVMAVTFNTTSFVFDLYRSQNGGFSWTSPATPVEFKWVSLSQSNRVYALNGNSIYYSHNNGTTWSIPITVTSLPVNIDIYGDRVYMASSTRMFLELYNYDFDEYQYWKIDFVPGAGATATASAAQVTLPLGTSFTKITAEAGNFYQYKNFPSPDQFAYSTDGGANWTTRTLPTNASNFFVADNGYILVSDQNTDYIYISSTNGVNYTQATVIPASASSSTITDIILDPSGFGLMSLDGEFVHRSNRVLVIPTDPTGLTTTSLLHNAIALQWTDNAATEEYYQIDRSVAGGAFSTIAQVATDEMCDTPGSRGYFVDVGVMPEILYEYKVTAVNDAGTSATLSVTPTTPAACAPDVPDGRSWMATNAGGTGYGVAAPLEVGVRHIGGGMYEVNNLTMSLTGGPVVDRFMLGCGTTVVLGTSTSEEIRPNGTGTWNGTDVITLRWRECGSVDKTEVVTLTLNATDPAPAPPTGVQVLVTGNSSVEISWTTSFYEKDYIVEKSTSGPASGFSQIGTNVDYPNNSLTDPGPFIEGAIYYYRVTARNNNVVPLSSLPSGAISLTFRKPNFIVSATQVTNFFGSTIGSYWGDFDKDGFDDLLTLNVDLLGGGFPTVWVFKNLQNGDFQAMLVDVENFAYGMATVVDFNNDGNLDIALYELDGTSLDLYQGNGDLTFTMLSPGFLGDLYNIEGEITSVSWSDVNVDGKLDVLILSEGVDFELIAPQLFLRNELGSYTKHSGGQLANLPNSGALALFADYDNDSYPDVLIVDGNQCALYKGNGDATFTPQPSSGIDPGADGAVSAAWGDYNADGNIDLYIGHSLNALYKNNGDGTFTKDISTTVTEGTSSFVIAPMWSDFNNDGLLDLITPGYISGVTRIYINTSVGPTTSFTKITTEKMSDSKRLHWGAATSDYNKDGFVDVSLAAIGLTSFSDPLFPVNFNLYENTNTIGNWSEVRLEGTASNSHAIGAKVVVQAGTKTIMREVQSPTASASQSSFNLHFGLGSESSITSITVTWPSGDVQVFSSPPINTSLLIEEDTQPPAVTLRSPLSGETDVSLSSAVAITFDEPTVRDNSKKIYIKRVSDGVELFSQSVSTGVPAGNKYTFTFAGPMVQDTEYAITFDDNAFSDIFGNVLVTTGAWTFTTIPGPQVTLLEPLDGAPSAPSNTDISITFDIPTTAVAGKNLNIYETSDLVTPKFTIAATAATPSGNKKIFNVPVNLLTETDYTVTLQAGAFKDVGNAVSAVTTWSFTTMVGPLVTSISPADGAPAVNANTPLVITFDQNVTVQSGKKISVYKDGVSTLVFETEIANGNTINEVSSFSLSPELEPSTTYTVIVDAFSFADATGNLFSGITAPTAWNFTTDPGPVVTTFLPANGASDVTTLSPITLTFNRSIASLVPGKKIEVFDGATSLFNTDVTASGVVDGFTYTIDAPGTTGTKWPTDKLLTVVLDAGAFRDVNYNHSQAVTSSAYTFTTMSGPQVVSLAPVDGATAVDANTTLVITFDQTVYAQGTKKIKLFKDGVATQIFQADVANGGSPGATFTFDGLPVLETATSYTVTVEAGSFNDEIGNPFAGLTLTTDWNFTTSPGAVVTTFLPLNNAPSVSTVASIELTFSRTLASAVPGKTIEVFDGATSIFVKDVSTDGTISGAKYTISAPSERWPVSKLLTVVLDAGAFRDVGENLSQGIASGAYSFTTMPGPQMSAIVPADESATIAANTKLAITFAQPVTGVATKMIKLFRDGDPTPVFEADVTSVTPVGNTVTFTPTTTLDPLTRYNVIIDASAFIDAVGNPYAGLGSTAWNFTTDVGPSVTSYLPAHLAVGVSTSADIEFTFNRTLVSTVAGKKIQVLDGASTILNANVSTGVIAGTKYTISAPALKWPAGKLLTVVLDAGAFRDGASNLSQGVASGTYTFTIDSGPVATSFSPAHGASGVSNTAPISITFNRSLSSAVPGKNIRVMDGATVFQDLDVSTNGSIVNGDTYTLPAPSTKWPAGRLLTVDLDAGAFLDANDNGSGAVIPGAYSFTIEVGPAVTTRVPAIGATGVFINDPLTITFNRNVTAIPGKTIRVMDGAIEVANDDVAAEGSVAGDTYTYPAPAGGWPFNTELAVLLDGGAFVDSGSKPSAEIAGTEWTFTTVDALDQLPPTITFTEIATADKHSLLTSLTATVSDNLGVQNTRLFIRGIGGSLFTEVAGTPGANNSYTYTFPSVPFDGIGAQYYFTAEDGSLNETRLPENETVYFQTYVRYNSTTSVMPTGLIGQGGERSGWRVISVPFALAPNNAVSSIFEELSQRVYKKDWRMLALTNIPTLSWLDYNDGFTNIDRGTGYMINIRTLDVPLSIANDITAPDNRRDNLFTYTLKAGWNMIGNPYLTRIDWDDVIDYNNLTGTALIFKKFNGNYVDNDLVAPFEGGFVKVEEDIEVVIPFEGQVVNGGRTKDVVFEEGDWLLPITLQQNDVMNTFGGVGMHHASMNSFDVLDNFNGPKFMDFIEMNFERLAHFPYQFSRDVVQGVEDYEWEFTVDASSEGLAAMTWDANVKLPVGSQLFLWDEATQNTINMTDQGFYEFDPGSSRKFKIYFGSDARSRIRPDQNLLGHPSPNPTSDISYIPFALPEGNSEYGVKIEVFDLMGRKTATLEDGKFAPGLYKTQWNGQETPHSNGLYSVRMTVVTGSDRAVYTGKILLSK